MNGGSQVAEYQSVNQERICYVTLTYTFDLGWIMYWMEFFGLIKFAMENEKSRLSLTPNRFHTMMTKLE